MGGPVRVPIWSHLGVLEGFCGGSYGGFMSCGGLVGVSVERLVGSPMGSHVGGLVRDHVGSFMGA